MRRSPWLCALVALVFVVRSGHSIKCYQCYSEVNKTCIDLKGLVPTDCTLQSYKDFYRQFYKQDPPATLTNLNNDDDSQFHDLFTCFKFEIKDALQHKVLRACEVGKILSTCDVIGRQQVGLDGVSCNACETDGCNGSLVPTPSILHTVLLAVGAMALASIR